ncbi:MAG: OstA-like protein [Niabella sp.]
MTKPYHYARFALVVMLILSVITFFAQNAKKQVSAARPTPPAAQVDTLFVLHSDKQTIQKLNDSVSLFILEGNVKLKQGKTLFYCNRCVKNDAAQTFEAWGKVHINDSDTTHVYADHLKYLTDKQMAYLDQNVKLTDGHTVLTTNSLDYDMNTKIATYKNNGKIVNDKTNVTSKVGIYYSDLKDAFFSTNVKVDDPGYKITSDSLLYNTESRIARFIAPTVIKDTANRVMHTRDGFYNLQSGNAAFYQRSQINDNKSTLIADSMALTTDIAQAQGNAIAVDSTRGTTIIANLIYQRRATDAILATQKPLMIIARDKDSTYITADTLFSAKLTDLLLSYNKSSLPDSIISLKDSVTSPSDSLSSLRDSTLSRPGNMAATSAKPNNNMITSRDSVSSLVDSVASLVNKSTAALSDSISAKPDSTVPLPKHIAAQPKNTPLLRDKAPEKATPQKPASNRQLTQQKKVKDNDSTNRYFEAYRNVRIFNDSMQALADSMFYSFKDSVFRLYQDPVVWGKDKNQVTGDTILLYTKNKRPHKFEAYYNGFMVGLLEDKAFNQIKASRLDGYFTNGELDSVRAKGSAECIYFMQDADSAYTGVNQSSSDIIDFYMQNKELKKVVFRGAPKGTLYPIRQASPEKLRLEKFRWLEARRPKTKFDVL